MGLLSNLFGGGKTTQTTTNRVDIPSFLQPYLTQGAGVAGGALNELSTLLRGNLVAPFSSNQSLGMNLARERALGGGGFIPAAQQGILSIAQGAPLSSFLPSSAFDALNSTASGDFLLGGSGFDAALDSATRSIAPRVLSTFGMGGPGAATGGLAKEAMTRAVADAFAGLYGQERANQLGAAGQLSALAGGERGRQFGALGMLPGIALADAGILSDIGAQEQAQSQREISAPVDALQLLLSSALGGLPISSLLGQTQTTTAQQKANPLSTLLGLGLTGASLFGTGGLSGLGGLSRLGGIGLGTGISDLIRMSGGMNTAVA